MKAKRLIINALIFVASAAAVYIPLWLMWRQI